MNHWSESSPAFLPRLLAVSVELPNMLAQTYHDSGQDGMEGGFVSVGFGCVCVHVHGYTYVYGYTCVYGRTCVYDVHMCMGAHVCV